MDFETALKEPMTRKKYRFLRVKAVQDGAAYIGTLMCLSSSLEDQARIECILDATLGTDSSAEFTFDFGQLYLDVSAHVIR